ncbi:MAG TPA: hypothetical protein VHC22_22455 [Pirellulales bacterium]|nr:hypothetical protein [Pirellulales bacterium]
MKADYYEQNHGEHVEPPAYNLRRWPILERKAADADLADEIQAVLEEPDNFADHGVPNCFVPGIGIAIDEGEHSTEVITCLMCRYSMFYKDGVTWKNKNLTDRGRKESGCMKRRSQTSQS